MGLLGRNGVVTIAAVAVGSCKNIQVDVAAVKEKEYVMGNDLPDSLQAGNKTISFSMTKLFVDSTHINQVLAGTVVAIVFTPEGVTTGKQKYTLNSCILDKASIKQAQAGFIMHDVTGEAMSLTVGSN